MGMEDNTMMEYFEQYSGSKMVLEQMATEELFIWDFVRNIQRVEEMLAYFAGR